MVRGTTFSGPYPEYMGSLRGAVEGYRTTMHFFGNQLTEVTADTGHCVTYGIAYHLGSGTGSDFVIGVRYRDDVVREGGRWLISGRVVEGVWRQPLGAGRGRAFGPAGTLTFLSNQNLTCKCKSRSLILRNRRACRRGG